MRTHVSTPARRILLLLLLLLPLPVSGGCQAVGDPSCALQDELSRDHGRDAFYAPGVSLTAVEQTQWYRCPPHWRPACPPLFRCPAPPRQIPSAAQVLALPETQSTD